MKKLKNTGSAQLCRGHQPEGEDGIGGELVLPEDQPRGGDLVALGLVLVGHGHQVEEGLAVQGDEGVALKEIFIFQARPFFY